MKTENFSNIPKSWQVKTLGEVCEIVSKGATPKIQNNTADKNSAIFLKAENVTKSGFVNLDNTKFIDFETHNKTLKRSMLKNLDILITIAGSLARCAVLEVNPNQQININQAVSFARLSNTKEVNPHFIKYYIMNPTTQLYLLSKAKTTAVPNLTLEIIRDIKIPLPPLNIQKRIVARLDEAFLRIDNGTKHLKSAQNNIAKYKQSLLKSAFNGTLTNESSLREVGTTSWQSIKPCHTHALYCHTEHSEVSKNKGAICENPLDSSVASLPQNDKTPDIASECNERGNPQNKTIDCHESAIADSRNDAPPCHTERSEVSQNLNNRDSSLTAFAQNDNKGNHRDISLSLNMTKNETPNLPQGWTIKTLGEIGEIVTGSTPNTKNKEYYGDEYPFYKPTDLNLGYFVENSSDMVSAKGFEISRKLPPKSILVTCIGATIGKTGFIRKGGICNQQINAIIPKQSICPEFVYFYCISNKMQELIKTNASATTLPILNKTAFSKLPISLPPLQSQKQIVEILEKHFANADKTSTFIDSALKNAKQLKSSLLKSAFMGKLI